MACDGYEHGTLVYLVKELPDIPVVKGTKGRVERVHPERHEIDVDFPDFGLYAGLDAHAFKPFTGSDEQGGTISTH